MELIVSKFEWVIMKMKIFDVVLVVEVSCCGLVKMIVIGGLVMVSSVLILFFSWIVYVVDSVILIKLDEKVIWSVCIVNCGSCCLLCMYVVDGEIKYVEMDNIGDDNYDGLYQVCVCLCGCFMCCCVYNLDCLKYLMKWVGVCGEGKFECISWEEVYDIIVINM